VPKTPVFHIEPALSKTTAWYTIFIWIKFNSTPRNSMFPQLTKRDPESQR